VFVKRLYFPFRAQCQGLLLLALLGSFIFSAAAKPVPPEVKPYGITVRTSTGAFLDGRLPEVAPSISGNWSAIVAFTNLLFTNSVGLCPVPGTDQLCVWEREGRVWTFQNSPGTTEKKLVFYISNQCHDRDLCQIDPLVHSTGRLETGAFSKGPTQG
jgi:hypothetical protein